MAPLRNQSCSPNGSCSKQDCSAIRPSSTTCLRWPSPSHSKSTLACVSASDSHTRNCPPFWTISTTKTSSPRQTLISLPSQCPPHSSTKNCSSGFTTPGNFTLPTDPSVRPNTQIQAKFIPGPRCGFFSVLNQLAPGSFERPWSSRILILESLSTPSKEDTCRLACSGIGRNMFRTLLPVPFQSDLATFPQLHYSQCCWTLRIKDFCWWFNRILQAQSHR